MWSKRFYLPSAGESIDTLQQKVSRENPAGQCTAANVGSNEVTLFGLVHGATDSEWAKIGTIAAGDLKPIGRLAGVVKIKVVADGEATLLLAGD